jgi:hypothetical protein
MSTQPREFSASWDAWEVYACISLHDLKHGFICTECSFCRAAPFDFCMYVIQESATRAVISNSAMD